MLIHVCFGLYDKTGSYSKFTGTAILSLFENTNSEVNIHILHDNTLTNDNRDKFIYLAGRYNQIVKFYNVEKLCADKITHIRNKLSKEFNIRFSVAAIYRFLIPQILNESIKKIIYLDSDVIVNIDVKELWQFELNDKPLAAVAEAETDPSDHPRNASLNYLIKNNMVGYDDYFNSGVLLINVKFLRDAEDTLLAGMKFVGDNPQLRYFDQDVLNYLFAKDYLKLSARFNSFARGERFGKKNPTVQGKIYHYNNSVGGQGIGLNLEDNLNRLWFGYFMKTPWFNEEAIGKLYKGVQQMHIGLKNSMVQISSIVSNKTRAFFATPKDIDGLKKFFSIRDNEEIILAENQESIKKLLNAMKKARSKKVFFIIVPNFPFNSLIQAGFTYGKDFLNGFEFLSEAQGVSLNSYPLIQAM